MAWKTVNNNGITVVLPSGGTDSLRVVFDDAGRDVAYVVPNGSDNGNHNAAVIAAAPSLLDACRRVWDAVLDTGADLPDDILLAAFDCRRAVIAAVLNKDHPWQPEQWIAARRRDQSRCRQRRCRAKKRAAKEATDGTQAR
jgi:hypothetical protein